MITAEPAIAPVDREDCGQTPACSAPGRFAALDSMRGFAALAVAFFHISALHGIVQLPLIRGSNSFVDFFFVLSGFVIAASYGGRIAAGYPIGRFMLLRIGRVWPLHLVMVGAFLVVEITVALWGRQIGLEEQAFTGLHAPGFLLRAVLLLDGFFESRVNYYNGASWSVSVELLAYILAALAYRGARRGVAALVILGWAALAAEWAAVDLPLISESVLRCVSAFGLGVGCFLLHQRWAQSRIPYATAAEVLVVAILLTYVSIAGIRNPLIPCAIPSSLVIIVLAREQGALSGLLRRAPFQWLGKVSYTVYMVHGFVVFAFMNLMLLAGRWGGFNIVERVYFPDGRRSKRIILDTIPATLLELLMIGVVLVVAEFAWRWIEEPARQWSRRTVAAM